jgi:hypothetical protein
MDTTSLMRQFSPKYRVLTESIVKMPKILVDPKSCNLLLNGLIRTTYRETKNLTALKLYNTQYIKRTAWSDQNLLSLKYHSNSLSCIQIFWALNHCCWWPTIAFFGVKYQCFFNDVSTSSLHHGIFKTLSADPHHGSFLSRFLNLELS